MANQHIAHINPRRVAYSIILILYAIIAPCWAQQVDIGSLGKQFSSPNPLRINGSLSASSIGYLGDSKYGRDPYSYYFNGNLQISLFQQINMPFSFNFTNAGSRYAYPTLPNRLSLHPSYKSVKAHIGDVSLSYSPYTLNGIQFRGLGLELSPTSSPWRLSAIYGRLQKAVAYDSLQRFILPSYKRMAYSSKITYEQQHYQVGFSIFSANDNEHSLQQSADSHGIVPAKNIALSGTANLKIGKDISLEGEYAVSSLTRDKRETTGYHPAESADYMAQDNNSTQGLYTAWRANLHYQLYKSVVGLGYERIAPGYETLGAYYFSNDFENFTFNYMQPLLKEKANIAINLGLQRDDLERQKASRTNRFIGSANLNINPSQYLNASLSYSNFQTHVNIKPQFDYINATDQFYRADTLNFIQLSQNASANINYILSNDAIKSQNLNLNLTYQIASDEQGGIVQKGNASGFYSGMASYSISLPKPALQLSGAFNYTHNTIGRQDTRTLGPTLAISKKFFDNKLQAGLSSSYNSSIATQLAKTSFMNIRLSTSYSLLKKHNLGLSIINQSRKLGVQSRKNDLTATLTYNYAFSLDNFWTKKNERAAVIKQEKDQLVHKQARWSKQIWTENTAANTAIERDFQQAQTQLKLSEDTFTEVYRDLTAHNSLKP